MRRFEAEVVVVGAGPAGATVARLLSMAGRDVLLLDRAVFPRPKPCGDCLSAEAAALLERLGLLDAVEAERPAHLDGWRIHAPGGARFEARFRDLCPLGDRRATALALPRERLDAVLLAAAAGAGTRLMAPAVVTDPLTGLPGVRGRLPGAEPFEARARLVIACDGLRSTLVRRHGLLRRAPRVRKVSLTAHVRGIAADAGIGEMHAGDGVCAGLAPVGSGLSNLTVVADSDRFGRELAADPRAFVLRVLERLPALRGRVPEDAFDAGPLLGSGPFDAPVRRPIADGLALVGDAAGYFDPFTGQGIHHALSAATLLAPIADAALRRAGPVTAARLEPYARERARFLRGTRATQRLVDAVLQRPRLADLAIARIAAAPAAARALLAVTGDMAPPAALISPRVLASLLVPSVVRSA